MQSPRTRHNVSLLIMLLAAICGGPVAAASEGEQADSPPVIDMVRTNEEMVLDGHTNEAVWSEATVSDNFSVFWPTTGLEPRFSARWKTVYTKEALYFYFEVDIGQDALLAPLNSRDSSSQGDRVEIALDTFGSGRRAVFFEVTAAGVLRDGLFDPKRDRRNQKDQAWDSLFDAAITQGPDRWTAEIRIPFQSLRFDENKPHFRAHVVVHSWRDEQAMTWAPIDRDANNWLPLMGHLNGLRDIEPGRTVELLPSLTTGWRQQEGVKPACSFDASPTGAFEVCGVDVNAGANVKWGITPSVTADLAFNPDFSEIEADPAQLEVNRRFALYLEERRPFFLEGLDLFKLRFGGVLDGPSSQLVYTRSINQPTMAAKVTGTEGIVRAGALVAIDSDPAESTIDEDFSVSLSEEHQNADALNTIARGEVDLGSHATIGVLLADKELLETGTAVGSNQVGGIDGQVFLTSQFSAEGGLFLSRAESLKGDELSGYATRGRLMYREDLYRIQSHYERISPEFRSETGYLTRLDYHNIFNKVDFFYHSESDWARVISPGVYTNLFLDDEAILKERVVGANNFWMFGGHTWLFTRLDRMAERIDDRWLDGTQGSIATGGETRMFKLDLGTSLGDAIIRAEELLGDRDPYVGWSITPFAKLTFRPLPSWSFSTRYRHNLLYEHEDGPLLSSEPIVRGKVQYFFTRDFHLRLITEWDGLDATLANDVLLSYVPTPVTVFFVGYREATGLEPDPHLVERSVFLKISQLFSL